MKTVTNIITAALAITMLVLPTKSRSASLPEFSEAHIKSWEEAFHDDILDALDEQSARVSVHFTVDTENRLKVLSVESKFDALNTYVNEALNGIVNLDGYSQGEVYEVVICFKRI